MAELGHVIHGKGTLEGLPDEIIRMILSQLDENDKKMLFQTSRKFYMITKQDRIKEPLRAFNQRTGQKFLPDVALQALSKLNAGFTKNGFSRFLDALYFLNSEQDIRADKVVISEGEILDDQMTIYTQGNRQFQLIGQNKEKFILLNEDGTSIPFRPDGPAEITRNYKGNVVKEEYAQEGWINKEVNYLFGIRHQQYIYNEEGNLHHETEPAYTQWVSNSTSVYLVAYYHNGELHRPHNLPAKIEWYTNGKEHKKTCYSFGVVHCSNDSPAFQVWDDEGNIQLRSYYRNGVLDRPNDEPAKFTFNKGRLKSATYYKEGRIHRENDQPADINYNDNGSINNCFYYIDGLYGCLDASKPHYIEYHPDGITASKKMWFLPDANILHREGDNPAEELYTPAGNLLNATYAKNGVRHRDGDNPAIVYYFVDTEIHSRLVYIKNGNFHRENDQPAEIDYAQNKKAIKKCWHENGYTHRAGDRPAVEIYNSSGDLIKESFYKKSALHREGDNPAETVWFDLPKRPINYVKYMRNGVLHRDNDVDGNPQPAHVCFNESGQRTSVQYAKNGVVFVP